jgi:hypothetical protein
VTTLAELARPRPTVPVEERCELCLGPLPPEHRHVADIEQRSLLCACRACVVLLARPGAGGGHFRLVPERVALLDDFEFTDEQWAALQLPVDLAFFFRSTATGRVVALYPSPVGATESSLAVDVVLDAFEPDVEALLVNRTHGRREHFLVPIDRCYELVALIRARWKGLAGGTEVWAEIDRFFDGLRARAEEAR